VVARDERLGPGTGNGARPLPCARVGFGRPDPNPDPDPDPVDRAATGPGSDLAPDWFHLNLAQAPTPGTTELDGSRLR